MNITHINDRNQPGMVDVTEKEITTRTACARAIVQFPEGILQQLTAQGNDRRSVKGPVFQVAILAGIQGAKKTSELIPLCHLIGLEKCTLHITADDKDQVTIECTVRATHKTGVEMEALTGVSIAALTIYDMCKGLSHEILIRNIHLVEKRGGKSDFG